MFRDEILKLPLIPENTLVKRPNGDTIMRPILENLSFGIFKRRLRISNWSITDLRKLTLLTQELRKILVSSILELWSAVVFNHVDRIH